MKRCVRGLFLLAVFSHGAVSPSSGFPPVLPDHEHEVCYLTGPASQNQILRQIAQFNSTALGVLFGEGTYCAGFFAISNPIEPISISLVDPNGQPIRVAPVNQTFAGVFTELNGTQHHFTVEPLAFFESPLASFTPTGGWDPTVLSQIGNDTIRHGRLWAKLHGSAGSCFVDWTYCAALVQPSGWFVFLLAETPIVDAGRIDQMIELRDIQRDWLQGLRALDCSDNIEAAACIEASKARYLTKLQSAWRSFMSCHDTAMADFLLKVLLCILATIVGGAVFPPVGGYLTWLLCVAPALLEAARQQDDCQTFYELQVQIIRLEYQNDLDFCCTGEG